MAVVTERDWGRMTIFRLGLSTLLFACASCSSQSKKATGPHLEVRIALLELARDKAVLQCGVWNNGSRTTTCAELTSKSVLVQRRRVLPTGQEAFEFLGSILAIEGHLDRTPEELVSLPSGGELEAQFIMDATSGGLDEWIVFSNSPLPVDFIEGVSYSLVALYDPRGSMYQLMEEGGVPEAQWMLEESRRDGLSARVVLSNVLLFEGWQDTKELRRLRAERGGNGTPLHAAALRGDERAVAELVAAGADPRARDVDGMTPLHNAALAGHEQAARVLIAVGAKVDAKNNAGLTALELAAFGGGPAHEEVVAVLVAAGARHSLHTAAAIGDTGHLVALLVQGDEVNATNEEGSTPLHWAAMKNKRDTMVLLIAAGADPKAENSHGETPADLALAGNSDAQTLALLDAAVMTRRRSKMPRTPSALAAEMRAAQIAVEAAQECLKQSKIKVAPYE